MSKKRKNNDTDGLFQPSSLKKRKTSKIDQSSIKIEDPTFIDYFVTKNKVTNITSNNKLSYRDESDAEYYKINEIDEDKLPPSLKHDKKYLIPSREHHNSVNLDDVNNIRHNIKQPFVNNDPNDIKKHIISIIPNGFHEILSVTKTLNIAMNSCKKDNEIINNNIKQQQLTTTKSNKPYNNVINKIEIVGKENASTYYNIMRLSKHLIDKTIEDFYMKKIKLENEFFKNDDYEVDIKINTDVGKSVLFKKLRTKYTEQYENRNSFLRTTAVLKPKHQMPNLTRSYIKGFRFPQLSDGERQCCNGLMCLFYTIPSFQSNQCERYIGKEFLLPNDKDIFEKTKELPKIIGPCIDCLLFDWTERAQNNIQYNINNEESINTFTVKIEENEYNADCCLPQTFRNGFLTGIFGFVPAYAKSQRAYHTEKRIIKSKYGSTEEVEVTYLAEINTDFRFPLVK